MRNGNASLSLICYGLAGGIVSSGVATPLHSQGRGDWANREFGIGVVRYADMYRYEAEDIIHASPNDSSETVAILKREDLCLTSNSVCFRSYDRMIEFDYEVPGFAILGFTPDSGWARVTLDPSDRLAPPTGWVRLRPPDVEGVLWRDLLAERAQFFIHTEDVQFYAEPGERHRVDFHLAVEGEGLDYILRPLAVHGRWLQVEVETPSTHCKWPAPPAARDTAWIEYLTEDMRPRVFFYTRGC